MDLEDIKKALNALDRKELQAVASLTAILLRVKESNGDEIVFYNTLNECLFRSTGTRSISHGVLKTRPQLYNKFHSGYVHLTDWLQNACSVPLNRVSRYAMYELIGEVLVEHIKTNIQASVSLKILIYQLHSVSWIMDRFFPGYARSGMLHMLIKQRDKPPAILLKR